MQRSKLRRWSDKKLARGRSEWVEELGLQLSSRGPAMLLHVFLIRSNIKNSQRASAATHSAKTMGLSDITCLPASPKYLGKIKKEVLPSPWVT